MKVKIKDPLLRSYLPGLFERRGSGFVVNLNSLTGTAITSLVKTSDYPERALDDEATVVFYLPKSHYNDPLRNKHLVVTKESAAKINACLREEFETKFLHFCAEARIQGYKQKEIIPVFLLENKIDFYDGDIETLKKRLYRKELSLYESIEEKLLRKAYLAACKVRKAMKNLIVI